MIEELLFRRQCEEDKAEAKCPECDKCGYKIWDDYYYDLGGDIYCEDCLNDEFRKSSEDYTRE